MSDTKGIPFNAATLAQIAAVRPDLIPQMHGILASKPAEQSGADPRDAVLKAAIALLEAVDEQYKKPVPRKYTLPYGQVNALREAVNATVMRTTTG